MAKVVPLPTPEPTPEERPVLVVDLGGQYSQLIARRVREARVYSELVGHRLSAAEVAERHPAALILSGGPASVYADGAPEMDTEIFSLGIPTLGICYGMQLMARDLGGTVERTGASEFGKAELEADDSELFHHLPPEQTVWMSHRDSVTAPPAGAQVTASSPSTPIAAFEDRARRLYGVQFHPEVAHTPHGQDILKNFLYEVAGTPPTWTPAAVIEEQVARIRATVGSERVLCALSGGVDSAVAALLVHKAVGDQLTCVFVDHGLLRENEAEQVVETFGGHFHVPLVHVQAQKRFLTRLAGISDPEEKRKIVGEEFIRVFEEEAGGLGDVRFLVQGTLYSDVIESGGGEDGVAALIKSHHNVGGLPADMRMELVEPLRLLFKDEVRRVGEELGLPERMVWRQPFPGPGLAIRIIGDVTEERLAVLRRADAILLEEIRRAGPLPRAVAELRRAAGNPLGRRPGRRAHVRVSDRHPGSHLGGRHDCGLGAHPVRGAGSDLESRHQRDPRRQPRRLRHLLEAAGDDRVGVTARAAGAGSVIVLLLAVSPVAAAPDALPRATADRPDDVSGPQIHAVYVLPADGADRALDTDGTIAASVANWQRWFVSQTLGGGLRIDTSGGELDVSFHRLARTDATLAARGVFLRDAIEEELRAAGFNRPDRIYAVYYDGSTTAACGGGAWPPTLPGTVAAVYMRATFAGGFPCYEPAFSRAGLQIMDFAILHEVLHTMGFVPRCAPHHTRDGHVSDDPRDVMYAGDEPWRPAVLDVGQDDYYHAHILGCRELAESPYLERNIQHPTEKLGVSVVGPGRVVSTPAGVRCKPRCSASLRRGTQVVLRAVPAKGARLVRWTGGCKGTKPCRLTMSGARSVTAHFRR